jgi:hypothetical protein
MVTILWVVLWVAAATTLAAIGFCLTFFVAWAAKLLGVPGAAKLMQHTERYFAEIGIVGCITAIIFLFCGNSLYLLFPST